MTLPGTTWYGKYRSGRKHRLKALYRFYSPGPLEPEAQVIVRIGGSQVLPTRRMVVNMATMGQREVLPYLRGPLFAHLGHKLDLPQAKTSTKLRESLPVMARSFSSPIWSAISRQREGSKEREGNGNNCTLCGV